MPRSCPPGPAAARPQPVAGPRARAAPVPRRARARTGSASGRRPRSGPSGSISERDQDLTSQPAGPTRTGQGGSAVARPPPRPLRRSAAHRRVRRRRPPIPGLSDPASRRQPRGNAAPRPGAGDETIDRGARSAISTGGWDRWGRASRPAGRRQQMGPLFFDPEGADFTGWINHFKNEVYRNWIVPQAVLLGYPRPRGHRVQGRARRAPDRPADAQVLGHARARPGGRRTRSPAAACCRCRPTSRPRASACRSRSITTRARKVEGTARRSLGARCAGAPAMPWPPPWRSAWRSRASCASAPRTQSGRAQPARRAGRHRDAGGGQRPAARGVVPAPAIRVGPAGRGRPRARSSPTAGVVVRAIAAGGQPPGSCPRRGHAGPGQLRGRRPGRRALPRPGGQHGRPATAPARPAARAEAASGLKADHPLEPGDADPPGARWATSRRREDAQAPARLRSSGSGRGARSRAATGSGRMTPAGDGRGVRGRVRAARGAGDTLMRRRVALPRRAARCGHGQRHAHRGQRAQPRGLPPGRGAQRAVADALPADRGAEGPGGGRAHLRAAQPRRLRGPGLRHLRHPGLPGLPRQVAPRHPLTDQAVDETRGAGGVLRRAR